MKVAVAGVTGLIGRRLAAALVDRGDDVVGLSRGAAAVPGVRMVRWNPADGPVPPGLLHDVDAVVNLAGAPIGRGRWTAARKREIRDSRVVTTRRIVEALGGGGPRTLVNASAVGYYATGEQEVDESAPAGEGFLAEVCTAWEAAARSAEDAGVRVVRARMGVVLAREGGALPTMALPVRLLAGGPLGGGRQWVPWIHVADAVGLILLALDRDRVSGAMNVTAPRPARQRDLVTAIARALGRPAVLPAPAVLVRLALGEMSVMALEGQRAAPRVALDAGYRFAYEDVLEAVRAELAPATP
ncbi:MAG: TIGR01777 family oxidoreductase [Actinomycetota bacterium]